MNKLEVIIAVRCLFDIGLGKAKALVDAAETVHGPVFTVPNSEGGLKDMAPSKAHAFFVSVRSFAQRSGVIA